MELLIYETYQTVCLISYWGHLCIFIWSGLSGLQFSIMLALELHSGNISDVDLFATVTNESNPVSHSEVSFDDFFFTVCSLVNPLKIPTKLTLSMARKRKNHLLIGFSFHRSAVSLGLESYN